MHDDLSITRHRRSDANLKYPFRAVHGTSQLVHHAVVAQARLCFVEKIGGDGALALLEDLLVE